MSNTLYSPARSDSLNISIHERLFSPKSSLKERISSVHSKKVNMFNKFKFYKYVEYFLKPLNSFKDFFEQLWSDAKLGLTNYEKLDDNESVLMSINDNEIIQASNLATFYNYAVHGTLYSSGDEATGFSERYYVTRDEDSFSSSISVEQIAEDFDGFDSTLPESTFINNSDFENFGHFNNKHLSSRYTKYYPSESDLNCFDFPFLVGTSQTTVIPTNQETKFSEKSLPSIQILEDECILQRCNGKRNNSSRSFSKQNGFHYDVELSSLLSTSTSKLSEDI